MNVHFGFVKHPGSVMFVHNGYWYEDGDGRRSFNYYSEPKRVVRHIRKMWGFSTKRRFFGIMTFEKE